MPGPLVAPGDLPDADVLERWYASAFTGAGTPWLARREAVALARLARDRGAGVTLMEAAATMLREPPRESDWEILGADAAGENWEDHRDPARAYALFCRKIDSAARSGARLSYRIWLALA